MNRAFYVSMIVLMVLWTAVLAADLVQSLIASGIFAAPEPEQTMIQTPQNFVRRLSQDLWRPTSQARAIVWGLPMIVFALVAAISQR